MKMSKWIVMAMTGVMLTAGSAMAQDQGGAGGGGGPGGGQGGRGGRGGNFDPAQFQKMMLDGVKQRLEVSDEDWKAIEPLVSEVKKQQMASRMSGRGMMGGRGGRGGPGGGAAGGAAGGAGAAPAEVTPTTELAKVLENKNATPEEIKAKVDAFRAKQKANKEALAKSQEALRQVLTARQEAQLILMGMLE
jgi:Spy/CpxP family protein refolding chaperone